MNVHVIGPVIRHNSDDRFIKTATETIALSAVYDVLAEDKRFTAHLPLPNHVLDAVTPAALFKHMHDLIGKADQVVWVYQEGPPGAIEAGLAIAAGKRLHLLAGTRKLPRIIRGIPNVVVSTDVAALCDEVAKKFFMMQDDIITIERVQIIDKAEEESKE
ncbi:MAG TPA: hypothetical protein VGA84_05145 [Thermoanaerobaculia bacterium]